MIHRAKCTRAIACMLDLNLLSGLKDVDGRAFPGANLCVSYSRFAVFVVWVVDVGRLVP